MLKNMKLKLMGILGLSMAALVCAQETGQAPYLNSLDSIATAINSISSKVTTVIAPAMIGLVIVMVVLAIVIKVAKRGKSAG